EPFTPHYGTPAGGRQPRGSWLAWMACQPSSALATTIHRFLPKPAERALVERLVGSALVGAGKQSGGARSVVNLSAGAAAAAAGGMRALHELPSAPAPKVSQSSSFRTPARSRQLGTSASLVGT